MGAIRRTLPSEASVRVASNDVPSAQVTRKNNFESIRKLIKSDALKLTPDGDILVSRNDATDDDSQWHMVRLGGNPLPASSLELRPRTFAEELEAIGSIVLVADRLLRHSTGEAIGQHKVAAFVVATLCKFWEYLWLHDIYTLKDLREEHFITLARRLASGGWAPSLAIRARAKALFVKNGIDASWYRTNNGAELSLTADFRAACRTNATGSELYGARRIASRYLNRSVKQRFRRRSSASLMLQWLYCLNELHYIHETFACPQLPFESVRSLAESLGRPAQRTKSLDVSFAGSLLTEAATWMSRGGALIKIARDIVRFEKKRTLSRYLHDSAFASFLSSGPYKVIEAWGDLPSKLKGIDRLNRCFSLFYIACFLTIATFNARRKDEVASRKYGIQGSNIHVISLEKHLYQGIFYCAKNSRDWLPFFVNQETFEAWSKLKELQEVFLESKPASKYEGSLFWRLTIGRIGFNDRQSWPSFGGDKPAMTDFVLLALPLSVEIPRLQPHTCRRFYALIFYYRYEDATLQALAFQLDHTDLESARQYVSEAVANLDGFRLPIALSAEKARRRDEYLADFPEMADVRHQKFVAKINEILDGSRTSGKFGALMVRIASKLAARADFAPLRSELRAKKMTAEMERKGYDLEPFPHADCMAGSAGRVNAKCFDRQSGLAQKERAAPKLCSGCIYSNTTEGHVVNLEMLYARLKDTGCGDSYGDVMTVRAKAHQKRLDDLKDVIALHRRNLGDKCV